MFTLIILLCFRKINTKSQIHTKSKHISIFLWCFDGFFKTYLHIGFINIHITKTGRKTAVKSVFRPVLLLIKLFIQTYS